MVELIQAQDEMLARLGETGSLEECKDARISLHVARGRAYNILSRSLSFPWNRKFFRPKTLLEPLDICLLDDNDWGRVKSIVDGIGKYFAKMPVKQAQAEFVRVFGHAVSQECPPYEMQYGTEGVDHISVELEFLSYMCYREAYAIENDHDERKIAILRTGVKKFMRNHVGRWTPLFCLFASRKAERGLYKDIISILSIFLKNEVDLMGVEPVKVEEPEYRTLSYSMENDLVANAPSECEPAK